MAATAINGSRSGVGSLGLHDEAVVVEGHVVVIREFYRSTAPWEGTPGEGSSFTIRSK